MIMSNTPPIAWLGIGGGTAILVKALLYSLYCVAIRSRRAIAAMTNEADYIGYCVACIHCDTIEHFNYRSVGHTKQTQIYLYYVYE